MVQSVRPALTPKERKISPIYIVAVTDRMSSSSKPRSWSSATRSKQDEAMETLLPLNLAALSTKESGWVHDYSRLAFKDSFKYPSGPSTAKSNSFRASFAKRLNPAPGNHAGTYLTFRDELLEGYRSQETRVWTNVVATY